MGIWQEDGTIVPKAGYLIVYSWRKAVQPNDAYSDHLGVVESVKNVTIGTFSTLFTVTAPIHFDFFESSVEPDSVFDKLVSKPELKNNDPVHVCDTIYDSNDEPWYYVYLDKADYE